MKDLQQHTCHGFGLVDKNGHLEFDSLADTEANVRTKYLELCMGWRFEHPDRFSQDEAWERILKFFTVVPVVIHYGKDNRPTESLSTCVDALRAIVAHQEAVGGGLALLSATRRIAQEALDRVAESWHQ